MKVGRRCKVALCGCECVETVRFNPCCGGICPIRAEMRCGKRAYCGGEKRRDEGLRGCWRWDDGVAGMAFGVGVQEWVERDGVEVVGVECWAWSEVRKG